MLDQKMFWPIVNIIVLLIEFLGLFLILDKFGKRKIEDRKICINIIIILVIIQSVRLCDIYPEYNSLLSLLLWVLFYKINYDVNWSKAIIIPATFIMLVSAFDLFGATIVKVFNNIDSMQLILEYNIYRLEGIIISKCIFIICIVLIKCQILSDVIKTKDFISIGMPIVVNIFSILYIFKYEMLINQKYSIGNNGYIYMSLLLCISSISLVFIVLKIAKQNKMQIENTLMIEKIKMEYTYYKKLEEQQKKINRIHHDMKNHMICINSLSDNEDVKKYIDSINLELSNADYTFNTGNKIVDIIMSEKKYICDKNNIELQVIADLSKVDFIKMNHICVIFSNALDNAIQACNKIKDENIKKYIKLNITYVNKFCIVKIENSKVNKVLQEDEVIKTDKKDSFYHGIGIKNIKNAISNYNGEVDINFDENIFALTLMIPLKLSN